MIKSSEGTEGAESPNNSIETPRNTGFLGVIIENNRNIVNPNPKIRRRTPT